MVPAGPWANQLCQSIGLKLSSCPEQARKLGDGAVQPVTKRHPNQRLISNGGEEKSMSGGLRGEGSTLQCHPRVEKNMKGRRKGHENRTARCEGAGEH